MAVKNSHPRPEPALQLERFLPYRLTMLAETVSRSLSGLYAERFALSVAEWRVIATLGQYPAMTAKRIGQHSHMHKTKVSRAVAQLAARNYLAREPNASDKRERLLTLTPRGRAVYDTLAPEALGFAGRLIEGLSREEARMLGRLIDTLQERARDLQGAGQDRR